jgi:hypothetical protein
LKKFAKLSKKLKIDQNKRSEKTNSHKSKIKTKIISLRLMKIQNTKNTHIQNKNKNSLFLSNKLLETMMYIQIITSMMNIRTISIIKLDNFSLKDQNLMIFKFNKLVKG